MYLKAEKNGRERLIEKNIAGDCQFYVTRERESGKKMKICIKMSGYDNTSYLMND